MPVMRDLHFMDPFQPVPEDQQIPRAIAHAPSSKLKEDMEEGSTLNVRIIYKCNEATPFVCWTRRSHWDRSASVCKFWSACRSDSGLHAEGSDIPSKQHVPERTSASAKISNTILLLRRGG